MPAVGGRGSEVRARTLAEPHDPWGLPRPAYQGASLANVTATVARALEIPTDSPGPMAPPLEPSLDPLEGRRPEGPVVIFLVDGLGWSMFDRWVQTDGSEAAQRWGRLARPITTVYPTSTAAALLSLSTGAAPAQHGLVGYRQYLPAYGVVGDMLKMTPLGAPASEGLVGPEWSPALMGGTPTVFRQGLRGAAISRDRFQGAGFTRWLYDGAEYVPWTTASDFAVELAGLLDRPRPPDLILAYWDELDTVSHFHGPADPLNRFELERLAHLIGFVARRVAPARARSTAFWITADHGQVPLDPARQIELTEAPEILREMIRPLAGDRRGGLLAARPGRREALRDALAARLPPGSTLLDIDEAIAAGLWGPPPFHPELADRLGDLLALLPSPWGMLQRMPASPPRPRSLRGGHGGLDPEELLVPLVGGQLDDFSAPG
ncbi:MAG: alkaline phosphatase family protein [Thermoplasmata archaeon]